MTNQIDLSKELTPEFYKQKHIKKGSVLIFQDENDKKTELKIVRLNRKSQICIVEPVTLYTEDEINAMPKEQAEEIIKNG